MAYLSIFLINFIEILIFGVVIYVMLPLRKDQKMARQEFQKFLFVGFLDRRQLEAAIMEKYPNLSQSALRYIRNQLDEMEELMTQSSQDIATGMLNVPQQVYEDRVFSAWLNIRLERARNWDEEEGNDGESEVPETEQPIRSTIGDDEMAESEDLSRSLTGFEDF